MDIVIMSAVLILLYLLLVWRSGRIYPIMYLFLLTYFIQYIYSTFLIYYEYRDLKYQMTISADRYFNFAIPAMISLFLGVIFFNRDIDIRESLKKIDPRQASKLGYLLLVTSYSFDFLQFVGLSWIGSIVSFTAFFKFIAAFCFLFTKSKRNLILVILVYMQLIAIVLQGGVFITFFIWATFLYFFVTLKFQMPFWLRSTFILVAFPILVTIQSVKDQYRAQTWTGKREGGIGLLSELAEKESERNENEPFSQSNGMVKTIGRLTQGWHVGMTLKQVPAKQPFSDGDEFLGDIASSILPRIIFSDKKTVNSQEKFYKYTGHKLSGNTSMTIGMLGDFYINFGREGAFIGLFLLGAIVSLLMRYFIKRYVLPDPINIIWIPFILNYLIRGNNDFYIFFNGVVKGFLIFLAINYIRFRFLNAQTWEEYENEGKNEKEQVAAS